MYAQAPSSLAITAAVMLVALTVSAVCWALLGRPLRQVLALLCDHPQAEVKAISGMFWQRLYLALTLLLPLFFVLVFAPRFSHSLGDNLLYALRWSIFGGISLLLVLAYLVRQQIRLLAGKPANHDTPADSTRHAADTNDTDHLCPSSARSDNGLPPLFK